MIVKPLGQIISVTSANTVANTSLVRIHASSATTVTIASGDITLGSFSMPANTVDVVEKAPLDTIACSAAANCTPIAYKH
jgi:hypothetical protein